MRSIRTILAATALDGRSRAVIARAAALARERDARLVLVHANLPAPAMTLPRLRPSRRPKDADALRAQFATDLDGLDVDVLWHDGPAAQVVTDCAQQVGANLVVLGLHRPRRVLDSLRTTTMEQITLAVSCPVLIAHTLPVAPYKRVLGAVTFAPASAHALGVAARIAPWAELHAIHALQLALHEKMPGAQVDITQSMTEAELLRDAFLRLPNLPDRLHLPEIVHGGVHEVLQFRMNELRPDLLVIGSHSGRDPASLGNYARDLMRAPPTDLLIAKPV